MRMTRFLSEKAHPQQASLDETFAQAMVLVSPHRAFNALRHGANGDAYLYAYMCEAEGGGLLHIAKSDCRESYTGDYFFNAGYLSIFSFLANEVSNSHKALAHIKPMLALIPLSTKPRGDEAMRAYVAEKLDYQKPERVQIDMLDVSLELARQGVNPNIAVSRRDTARLHHRKLQ